MKIIPLHKPPGAKCVSVRAEVGDRMDQFGLDTGIPMSELVTMACRDEIIAGGKILRERERARR